MKKNAKQMEMEEMEYITIELPHLSKGVESVKVINGKKCVFKLIAISDIQQEKVVTTMTEEEYPGIGLLGNIKISDQDIEEAKYRSLPKTR